MSSSLGLVCATLSYGENQSPSITLQPYASTCALLRDSAIRTSSRVLQPFPFASIQCLKYEREYPVLYSFCTVIVARTDNAVGFVPVAPFAMVVATTLFFFNVVVVFFASGDGAAPEELTHPTVTASARAGKTIKDLCKRRDIVLDIFISSFPAHRTSN